MLGPNLFVTVSLSLSDDTENYKRGDVTCNLYSNFYILYKNVRPWKLVY